MERKELELVLHPQIENLNIFLVQMQSRAPHLHEDLEIGMILRGSIQICESGRTHTFSSNQLYLLNSMATHEIHALDADSVILAIQISPLLFHSAFLDFTHTHFSSCNIQEYFSPQDPHFQMLCALCIELAYHYFGHLPRYEFKCISMVNMVMYLLRQHVPCRQLTAAETQFLHHKAARIQRVLAYTDEHCCQKLLLSDIARQENLSLTYLSHLFKEMLGINFQTYLNEKRFEQAFFLLENTNHSVLDISLNCGFSDVRYLNRMFQQRFGCAPAEYRKQAKRKQQSRLASPSDAQRFYSQSDSILLLDDTYAFWHNQLKLFSLHDFYQ